MKKSYKLLIMAKIFPYLLYIYIFQCTILPMWIPAFHGLPLVIEEFLRLDVIWFLIALTLLIVKGICVLRDDTYTADDLLKSNRNYKLVQIPAYLIGFILGVYLVVTVILIIGVPIIIIFNLLSILLSGIWGTFCMMKLKKEQEVSTGRMVLYSFLQFIFCIDVVSAVLLPMLYKRDR